MVVNHIKDVRNLVKLYNPLFWKSKLPSRRDPVSKMRWLMLIASLSNPFSWHFYWTADCICFAVNYYPTIKMIGFCWFRHSIGGPARHVLQIELFHFLKWPVCFCISHVPLETHLSLFSWNEWSELRWSSLDGFAVINQPIGATSSVNLVMHQFRWISNWVNSSTWIFLAKKSISFIESFVIVVFFYDILI